MEFLSPTGIRTQVTAATPLPVAIISGGGGGGSASQVTVNGIDAATAAALTNPFPVEQVIGGAPASSGNPVPILALSLPLPSGASTDATFSQVLTQNNSLGALNASLQVVSGRKGTMIVQVTGTFVGTLQLQGTVDGANYVAFSASPQFLNLNTGAYTATITAPGVYQTSVNGLVGAKVVMSAYTSGAAVVSASLTDGPAMIALDASLPAGSNSIGTVNIGNTPSVASTSATGSPAALNANVDGTTDLAGYGSISVQVTGTWSGTLTFQVSNDGTNWVSKNLYPASGGALTSTTGANGVWFGPSGARYFRVTMSAYTSGTAVVTARYNSATIELPIQYTVRAQGGADAQTGSNVDEVAVGAVNSGGTLDRLRTAGAAASGAYGLSIASGVIPLASINAASAPATGGVLDNTTARPTHTIQVDVTTTAVGTAGTHSVVLEGSLDGTYYTTLATVTPASTSTTATDPSNHANASVGGFPYRYVRARWASIPTSWTGTLTARVVSAG